MKSKSEYAPHKLIISSNQKGRTFIVGDIHGCLNTFNSLIESIGLQKNDYFILLGDYVNKGKESIGTLFKIIELQEQGFQIFPLRGNHEEMILEEYNQSSKLNFFPNDPECEKLSIQSEKKLVKFLNELPYYARMDNTVFVHAGINSLKEEPLCDYKSMLWMRDFDDLEEVLPYRVIHGHEPTYEKQLIRAIEQGSDKISLDNGCVFKNKFYLGKLACLELNNMKLTLISNIE